MQRLEVVSGSHMHFLVSFSGSNQANPTQPVRELLCTDSLTVTPASSLQCELRASSTRRGALAPNIGLLTWTPGALRDVRGSSASFPCGTVCGRRAAVCASQLPEWCVAFM